MYEEYNGPLTMNIYKPLYFSRESRIISGVTQESAFKYHS